MKTTLLIITLTICACLIALGVWFFFLRSTSPAPSSTEDTSFGVSTDNQPATPGSDNSSNNPQTITNTSENVQQKIFQITQGPVVGATLIQTLHPTTTIARYISQNDGHVFDMPLDVPGVVPRIVSNITIPAGVRALWLQGGGAALLQYLDDDIVKTVYLGFPPATTSAAVLPTKIQFLPDAIVDIAASPDGKSVAYLLKTASGVDGYTARSDGTASKKLFSLPLSQMLISWPSQTNLLVETKSAVGISGLLFSIDAKTGASTPLVSAKGLTAIADSHFAEIIYQSNDGINKNSYVHDIKKAIDMPLGFDPFPEKCIWGTLATLTLYCASPLQNLDPSYLDFWHQGAASAGDAIFAFNLSNTTAKIMTVPGGKDGGTVSDILEMALSPDEHYLSFVNKTQRALWGVRLGN